MFEAIKKSVQEHGLQDHSPVLIDDQGRILGGRHQLQAAKELGIEWPKKILRGLDDEEALAIAITDNIGEHWTKKDRIQLEKDGLRGKAIKMLRQLVEQELIENPRRTGREIAELTGSTIATVQTRRISLEETGKIEVWRGARAPIKREAIIQARAENPNLSKEELAKITGSTPRSVSTTLYRNNYNSKLLAAPVPENIKQALIDYPTLNHNGIGRKIGVDQSIVKRNCTKLIAAGVYNSCQHRLTDDGRPAVGRPVESKPYLPISAPDLVSQLQARIAELEAELAAARARIEELEMLASPQRARK